MTRIHVDTRFAGQHGIARYAAEVVPRLNLDWSPFDPGREPTSPRGMLSHSHLALDSRSILYSPGFNVGFTRALQVPTIHDLIHIHEPRSGKGRLHSVYYERVVKPAVRRSGHVFTVSSASADAIRGWIGNDVTIHNTENGCSEAFTPDGASRTLGSPYLLYVGNFKPHKNPQLVFAAAALLPDLQLVVVSSDRKQAEFLADRHGLSERLTVLESIDDATLAQVYRGAAVLAFPSLAEGFGLPVLEALRCGTPVVYLEQCASVKDICGGFQYSASDARDAKAFADLCNSAASTPFEGPDLTRFDWAVVASRVTAVLKTIEDDS
jgi:glycosyltransferase involved in cell wall biosynthesis